MTSNISSSLSRAIAVASLAAAAATPAWSAVDVGVGITIREPGVYGHIELGSRPPPPLLYPQPVLISRPAVVVTPPPPMYLYVPPGHAKDWAKHCGKYNACARPVYFVQESWVQEEYQRAHSGKGPPQHAGNGKGKGKGKD